MKRPFTIGATAIRRSSERGVPAQAAASKANVTISAPKCAPPGIEVPIDIP